MGREAESRDAVEVLDDAHFAWACTGAAGSQPGQGQVDALLAGADSVALIRDDQGVVRVVGLEKLTSVAGVRNPGHNFYRLTAEGADRR
jgi:hypothetical protein